MSSIVFEPPLKSATVVRPATAGDASTQLAFRAILSSVEWRHLKAAGGIIEIWSNLPIAGIEPGQWHPIAFQEDVNKVAKDGQIHLSTSVPVQTLPGIESSTYSYTYRIKYASSRLQWLGNYGSNGSISIHSRAYWTPIYDGGSSVGRLHEGVKWKAWGLSTHEPPRQLSLSNDNQAAPVQILLLIPEVSQSKLSIAPSLLFSSKSKGITLSDNQVQCETPNEVLIQSCVHGEALAHHLRRSGVNVVPSSSEDYFFVATSNNQTTIALSPIWLSSHIPAAVNLKVSDLQSLLSPYDSPFVLYLTEDGPSHPTVTGAISQPILPLKDTYEIPLAAGFRALSLLELQTIPGKAHQYIGITSPASLLPSSSTPSNPLSSPTPTDSSSTSDTTTPDGATLTLSKSSRVLFAHTVHIPRILIRQVDRLERIKPIVFFYQLALYILTLVLPFFGFGLSLQWSATHHPEKPSPPNSRIEVKKVNAVTEIQSQIAFLVDVVQPEVQVVFKGGEKDALEFTLDGKKVVDSVSTWLGEDFHQYTLRVPHQGTRHQAILGVTIKPL